MRDDTKLWLVNKYLLEAGGWVLIGGAIAMIKIKICLNDPTILNNPQLWSDTRLFFFNDWQQLIILIRVRDQLCRNILRIKLTIKTFD